MGWGLAFDERWKRWVGYGVPAVCEHPGCEVEIDRGLSYVCGGEPFGGERGCGLYFCEDHRRLGTRLPQLCARCRKRRSPFAAKPDHPRWVQHLLTDDSWAPWRSEHPDLVAQMSGTFPEGR